MATFLNLKSAGYPGWAQTEEQKQQYVRDYFDKEGITLDPLLIEKNPGRKATAKLMLNSFWGKFGENLHKKTTEAVTTLETETLGKCHLTVLYKCHCYMGQYNYPSCFVPIMIPQVTESWASPQLPIFLHFSRCGM